MADGTRFRSDVGLSAGEHATEVLTSGNVRVETLKLSGDAEIPWQRCQVSDRVLVVTEGRGYAYRSHHRDEFRWYAGAFERRAGLLDRMLLATPAKAGGDDRDHHILLLLLLDHGSEDDLGLVGGGLIGLAGADTLDSGRGADLIDAGGGNDVVNGGRGNDVLNGDAGHDHMIGGWGRDTVDGGDGNDYGDLSGGDGSDCTNPDGCSGDGGSGIISSVTAQQLDAAGSVTAIEAGQHHDLDIVIQPLFQKLSEVFDIFLFHNLPYRIDGPSNKRFITF